MTSVPAYIVLSIGLLGTCAFAQQPFQQSRPKPNRKNGGYLHGSSKVSH